MNEEKSISHPDLLMWKDDKKGCDAPIESNNEKIVQFWILKLKASPGFDKTDGKGQKSSDRFYVILKLRVESEICNSQGGCFHL